MALSCLVYVFSTPFVGWLSNKIEKMFITQIAFGLATISLLLFGPSKLIGFPEYFSFLQTYI